MMKRAMTAVVACMAITGLGASPASARIADEYVNLCSGTAQWQLTFGPTGSATANVNITSANCKVAFAEVEDDGNVEAGTFNQPFTGSSTYNLVGATITGNPSFAGAAFGAGKVGHVEAVGGLILNATLTGAGGGAASTEQHTGVGGCGTNCYRTTVVWVGRWP